MQICHVHSLRLLQTSSSFMHAPSPAAGLATVATHIDLYLQVHVPVIQISGYVHFSETCMVTSVSTLPTLSTNLCCHPLQLEPVGVYSLLASQLLCCHIYNIDYKTGVTYHNNYLYHCNICIFPQCFVQICIDLQIDRQISMDKCIFFLKIVLNCRKD